MSAELDRLCNVQTAYENNYMKFYVKTFLILIQNYLDVLL